MHIIKKSKDNFNRIKFSGVTTSIYYNEGLKEAYKVFNTYHEAKNYIDNKNRRK